MVMGTAENNYVMYVALGFHTYQVMRHGPQARSAPLTDVAEQPNYGRLGCYS